MFDIKSIKAVRRDLKKFPREVSSEIEEIHFKRICQNPFQAFELGYSFKGLRSYHFSHKGTEYRIVYELFKEDRLIVVIMIGTRETFYEKLRKRIL